MATNSANIRIEPCSAHWGNPETTKITSIADVASSLQNSYYIMYSTDLTLYHVWNNVGGSGVDPAPANSVAIEVAFVADASAAVISAAAVTAIALIAGFNCKIDPDDADSYIIQNVGVGPVTAVVVDLDTTFTILQLRAGSDFDMGYLEGDITIPFSEDLFDVTAHQEGTEVIDRIRTGNVVGPISIIMKESQAANLQAMIEVSGGTITPTTKISGVGTDKRFTPVTNESRQLILHPIKNTLTDYTEDFCFYRAYPKLSELNFSGESSRKINVEFDIYIDVLVDSSVKKFGYGDHQQVLLK